MNARAARPRWLIASFSSGGELGHRAAVVAVGRARTPGRSRSRRSPRGLVRERALAAPVDHDRSRPPGSRRRRARRRSARADRRPPAPRAAASRGSPRRSRARPRSAPSARRARPRAPRPRCRSRRRSPAGRWPRPAARALTGALSAKVAPVSGGSSTSSGSGSHLDAAPSRRSSSRTLCWLRVARTSLMASRPIRPPDRPPACGLRASCSMPAPASASSSSSEARESGVRSAVACTSTSPPSPVITTFMSTSAVESSE